MRRADRLFQIIQLLRHRRLTTAAQLAERLEVSERTIYRDVGDLVRSGVPIDGEAGVGYRLGKDFELPPMMFCVDEIQALVLGARMVETWADDALRMAAKNVLDKVEGVLPPKERHRVRDTALFALSFRVSDEVRGHMGVLRQAVDDRAVVRLRYGDQTGVETTRTVRPLGLYFWGHTWTLAAWCDLRQAFRNFRLDRVQHAELTGEIFEHVSPVTLEEFIASMTHDRDT
jgi:predicted DNA-binding transcriptional regulator YafY